MPVDASWTPNTAAQPTPSTSTTMQMQQQQQQQTQQHAHVTSSPASALAATLPTTKLLSDASDSVLYYCADAMDAYEGYLLSQLPQHADQQDKVKMFAQQLFEVLRTNATAKLEVFQQRAVERCFAIPAKLRTALRRLQGGEEPMTEEQEQIAQEAALDEELTRLRAAVSAERRAASELHGEAAALKRELSSYEARVAKGATAPLLISGVDGVTDGKENEARIVEDAAVLVAAATKLQPLMQKADGLVTKVSEADETPEAVEAEIARRRAVLGGLGVGALHELGQNLH